ncbi:MAG TPA: UPF0175 family protein [Steroidobacteraceae bacterium]|nr:UPF0175 family protein [Steroidobacteraceae bacterium]
MKTITVADLAQDGAGHALRDAEHEPVLVKRDSEPTAWIISAERLSQAGTGTGDAAELYRSAMGLLAVDLYQQQTLTLGQAAKLAGMSLGDFIDLCGHLRVPVLWEPEGGIQAEVDALDALLPASEFHA